MSEDFPDATPVADMSDAEAAAYWRAESKKQQQKLEALQGRLRRRLRRLADQLDGIADELDDLARLRVGRGEAPRDGARDGRKN